MKLATNICYVSEKSLTNCQIRDHRSRSLEFHLLEICDCDILLVVMRILMTLATNIHHASGKN